MDSVNVEPLGTRVLSQVAAELKDYIHHDSDIAHPYLYKLNQHTAKGLYFL